MMVLPSGFTLPPLLYLVGLVGAALVLGAVLLSLDPPITQRTAIALGPWLAIGGALHAFYQLEAFADPFAPLFGAPAVYVTTFVFAVAVWVAVASVGIIAGRQRYTSRYLGITGMGVLTVLLTMAIYQGIGAETLDPVWPSIALLAALVLTVLVTFAISMWRTPVFLRTRLVGPLVIFAHALDGTTTAIGADIIGVEERSPLPEAIMEFAADLPTYQYVGRGWLFLLVKLALASAIVIAFNRYVDEEPVQANLLLVLVAAVGLGPATNNLVLFLVGKPV